MYLLTKRKIRKITDRCWIPIFLTKEVSNMKPNRWLVFVISLIVIFLFISVLLVLSVKAEDSDFPYKNWNIVSVKLMPDGMFYIVFANPDPTDEIRAVVIILVPVAEVPLREKPPPQNKGLGVAF